MRYVCDAPAGRTWFALETEADAEAEALLMRHAVNRHFNRAWAQAAASFQSADPHGIGRDIGLKDHIRRTMPVFATLRDADGAGLATAMLPPGGRATAGFRVILVGPDNADPYPAAADAIAALGAHFGLDLNRQDCYPYR